VRHLNQNEVKKIEKQSFKNMIMLVRVDRVYDGDTYDIIFVDPFSKKYNRKRCRAYGYDSPEMKPLKSIPNRDQIKKDALVSKNALINRIKEGDVVCRVIDDKDKYGRLLADLYVLEPGVLPEEWCDELENHPELLTDDRNVCKWMIRMGYAKEYYGGKKE
jgi:endonuclease YncB( thermonuclease family)